jgi:dienelactone hydrolase
MAGENHAYSVGNVECEAYIASNGAARRPGVLIVHTFRGTTDFERGVADRIAALGYTGFAIDVYGKAARAAGGDPSAMMRPFNEDRAMLRDRLLAAVAAAKRHRAIDPEKMVVIGYCFGGMCALDVARSGAEGVLGAVSLHGVLKPPPEIGNPAHIAAKVLVLHGWADPHVPPDDVLSLAKELTDKGADWQIHAYGHTMHGFTNPQANSPERGVVYNANADRRSWQAMVDFLGEVFAE